MIDIIESFIDYIKADKLALQYIMYFVSSVSILMGTVIIFVSILAN
jgi:hypothetical protein